MASADASPTGYVHLAQQNLLPKRHIGMGREGRIVDGQTKVITPKWGV